MDLQTAKKRLDSSTLMSRLKHLAALQYLEETDEVDSVDLLVSYLLKNPQSERARDILVNMHTQEKNDRLWEIFEKARESEIGQLLKEARIPCRDKNLILLRNLKLGQIEGLKHDNAIIRKVLTYLDNGDHDIINSVGRYIRKLPQKQEINNIIFSVWMKRGSSELEDIISEQNRLPASGEKEALFYLVTGNVEGYHGLQDEDGSLFAEACIMASPTFNSRINQTVINSRDDQMTQSYQKALGHEKHFDSHLYIKALKESGNEEALFESVGTMDLLGALDLCERWQANYFKPSKATKAKVLERVLTMYKKVGKLALQEGESPPEGTKDLVSYWETQKVTDEGIREGIKSPDPFLVARSIYLGQKNGLVKSSNIDSKTMSEHWPLRLVSKLLFPETREMFKEHFIEWLSKISELNLRLLHTPIACTPIEYGENKSQLEQLSKQEVHTLSRYLLDILVTFQTAFADWLIVDDSDDAPEKGSIEVEDLPITN